MQRISTGLLFAFAVSVHSAVSVGPVGPGVLAATIAGIAYLVARAVAVRPSFVRGTLVSAGELALALCVTHALELVSAGRDGSRPLVQLSAAMFDAVGLPNTVSGGELLVRFPGETVNVAPNVVRAGLPPLVGALTVLLMSGASDGWNFAHVRRWALLAALAVAADVVRFVALSWLGSESFGFLSAGSVRLSTGLLYGWPCVVSFFVLGAALPVLGKRAARGEPAVAVAPCFRRAAPVALCVGVAGIVAAWRLPPTSEPDLGRVLVDDSHCEDWELAGVRFDDRWRGDMSVYACGYAVELLGRRFRVDVNRERPLREDLLKDYDIVLLKVPSRPYEAAELHDIEEFVASGGGVVAVGDHTDLFACNTHLNAIGSRHGITFEPTAVSRIDGGQVVVDRGLADPRVEDHAYGMEFLTGCSVRLTGLAYPVMASRSGFSDQGVCWNQSFFGDWRAEPAEHAGIVVGAACAEVGRGRIVAFSDGTPFTNFAAALERRYEALEACVALANVRPVHSSLVRQIPLLLLAAGALLALGAAPRLGAAHWVNAAIGAGYAAGWIVGGTLDVSALALPPVVRPVPEVAFLGDKAHYHLAPTIGGASLPVEQSFDTLFVECERFGLRPRFERSLGRSLAECRVLVVPNVFPRFSPDEFRRVRTWLEAGGIAFVTAGAIEATRSGLTDFAREFGAADAADWTLGRREEPPTGVRFAQTDGGVRLAGVDVGRGMVFVGGPSELMSRGGLGHPFPVPKDDRARRIEVLGAMLRTWQQHLGVSDATRWRE